VAKLDVVMNMTVKLDTLSCRIKDRSSQAIRAGLY